MKGTVSKTAAKVCWVVYCHHTYLLEQNGQTSVQNEKRLKLHTASSCLAGQAPTLSEPRRRPNMRGATWKQEEEVLVWPVPTTMLNLLSRDLPTIAPFKPVVDPIVDQEIVNNGNEGNNNVIDGNLDDNNIVPIVELPPVASTESVVDTTADDLVDYSDSSASNNSDHFFSSCQSSHLC